MEEDSLYKKRGGRKGKKRNKDKKRDQKFNRKQRVTHIDTLHDYGDEEGTTDKMEVIEKPPNPLDEPVETKFISDTMRKKLFGKDPFKDKDKKPRRPMRPQNMKHNRKAAPVNAAKPVKPR